MYQRILVPLDGSELAAEALPLAELIPSRSVRLLQIEPAAVTARRNHIGALAGRLEAARVGRSTAMHAMLAEWGTEFDRQGRAVEVVVETGDPAERIVASAADSDLIVMATRGRGANERSLYGSVADHVARNAPVPTLLIRAAGSPIRVPPLARVVTPLDGSAVGETALPTAASLARLLGLRCHLLIVVERAGPLAPARPTEREAAAYLEEQGRRLRRQDIVVTTEVRLGVLPSSILRAIEEGDLVVMGTRARAGLPRLLFGSTAEHLVRRAPTPIVLVRAGIAGAAKTPPVEGHLSGTR